MGEHVRDSRSQRVARVHATNRPACGFEVADAKEYGREVVSSHRIVVGLLRSRHLKHGAGIRLRARRYQRNDVIDPPLSKKRRSCGQPVFSELTLDLRDNISGTPARAPQPQQLPDAEARRCFSFLIRRLGKQLISARNSPAVRITRVDPGLGKVLYALDSIVPGQSEHGEQRA